MTEIWYHFRTKIHCLIFPITPNAFDKVTMFSRGKLLGNHKQRWIALLLLLTCLSIGLSHAKAQEAPLNIVVQTTDGQNLSGELVALDGQFLELVNKGEKQTLAFNQIEIVDFANSNINETTSLLQCRLADGSFLNAQKLSISGTQAHLQLSSGQQIKVAQNSLKSLLLFDPANNPDKLRQWDKFLLSLSAASDAIVAKKNEALQAIEGLVGDVSEDGFDFQMGGRQVTVKAEKLTGVIFYRADRELPDRICEIQLIDNSTIYGAQIVFTEGQLNIATGTGDRLVLPMDVIASLNMSVGRAIYLSDLLPTTNDWKPLVASQTNLENLSQLNLSVANKSFTGQPLSLRTIPSGGLAFLATTKTYEKGFAISGGGRLAFNLNAQFKRLTALAGFDPRTEALPGNVKLEIQVDNKIVLSSVLENRRLDQPLPVEVNLENAKRLVIRINYHDGRSVGDRVHLVDARLSR